MNPNKEIRVEKVTLNIGAGKDQAVLEKAIKLIKHITGIEPVKTFTNKRIPSWGLRPGLPIGCKLTLRDRKIIDGFVKRLLASKGNTLKLKNFDQRGSIAFGIPEYIDIANVNYNPDIGLMGLEACITLERYGFRIKRRKNRKAVIPKQHLISKEDAVEFMKKRFGTNVEEE